MESGWEEGHRWNILFSFLSLFCTLHKNTHPRRYRTYTQVTPFTTQPSGGILDRTTLVCYFLLNETWTYGKLLKSDCSLRVCLLNKKKYILFCRNGRNTSLRKTAFVLAKCSFRWYVNKLPLNCKWYVPGFQVLMEMLENENAGAGFHSYVVALVPLSIMTRLQSHLVTWHNISTLRRDFYFSWPWHL